MSKYFSTEELNTGRQDEFDIARAFSIVGMIITHCYECAGVPISNGFGYVVTTLLGGFLGAPLFMFYMGAAVRYSRRSTPAGLATRGLIIFALSYALNIFRRILPAVLLSIYWHGKLPASYYLILMCEADILQFAGLALITIAVVKKLELKDWHFILFSTVLLVIGMLTDGYDTGSELGNSLLGVLIGTKLYGTSGGYFSYCHYLIFVAVGYAAGGAWKRVIDKKAFFKRFSPIAAIVAVLGFGAEIYFNFGMMSSTNLKNYYYMSIYDVVFGLAGGLFMAGVYYWLDGVTGKKFHNFCRTMSYNIAIIYFFHLVLASWVLGTFMAEMLEMEILPWMVILASLVLTVLSYYVAKAIRPVKDQTV